VDLSRVPSGILDQFKAMLHEYIVSSRKQYIRGSAKLSLSQREAMAPFFPSGILRQARIMLLKGQRVEEPAFYDFARRMGIENLPGFSDTVAVTFNNLIVSEQELTNHVLFHELVHVIQYAAMGTREFADKYVDGFVSHGSYEEIPLEKMALKLENRFRKDKQPFSVADELTLWRQAGQF
jgi:hypothetical protein